MGMLFSEGGYDLTQHLLVLNRCTAGNTEGVCVYILTPQTYRTCSQTTSDTEGLVTEAGAPAYPTGTMLREISVSLPMGALRLQFYLFWFLAPNQHQGPSAPFWIGALLCVCAWAQQRPPHPGSQPCQESNIGWKSGQPGAGPLQDSI